MRTADDILNDMHTAMNHADVDVVQRCITEADLEDSPEGRALAHHGRGWMASFSGAYDAALAHYEAEILLRRDLGDVGGEAATIGNIGNVLINRGQLPEALERLRHAYDVYTSIGHRDGMARMLGSMATVYNRTGDYATSLEYNRKALQIHIDNDSLHGQAQVLGNIGNIYSLLGNYPEALDYMTRSLDLHRSLNDPIRAATVLGNIGTVYGGSGDAARAIDYLRQALEIQEGLGNANEIARLCSNLGYGYLQHSDHEQALMYLKRALSFHRETGNQQGEASTITMIVDANLDAGNIDEARAWLDSVGTIKVIEPDVAIHRLDNYGRIALLEGNVSAAQDIYQQALALAMQHELRFAQAVMHMTLRDLCQELNDFPGYIAHNNEYTRITEEINGRETATKLAILEKQREIDAREREHAQHMAVLHSTLPRHIADRVARGEAVNDEIDNAAVLFLDIAGFTSNTSSMPPTDVVKMLENIFHLIDGACEVHNVVKVKTIGDSYMCFRGDADAFTNAVSIARVAVHVMRVASDAAPTDLFLWPNGSRIQFRIGLHCGPVVAGVLGTTRLQYDVWGDTVNVASRLESTGEPGRIQVSEAFARELRESPELRESLCERGEVEIKGKGTMKTHWLSV